MKCCLSGRIALIKPKDESGYLYYCLNSSYFQFQIKRETDSTTLGVLGIMTLRKLFLALAPKEEQKSISKFLNIENEKIDLLIFYLESQLEKLQDYRQSLITSVVTGKIDVRQEIIA